MLVRFLNQGSTINQDRAYCRWVVDEFLHPNWDQQTGNKQAIRQVNSDSYCPSTGKMLFCCRFFISLSIRTASDHNRQHQTVGQPRLGGRLRSRIQSCALYNMTAPKFHSKHTEITEDARKTFIKPDHRFSYVSLCFICFCLTWQNPARVPDPISSAPTPEKRCNSTVKAGGVGLQMKQLNLTAVDLLLQRLQY